MDAKTPDKTTETLPPPILAIGSSAGGLNALTALFDALPDAPGAAIAIVAHLDPDHPSKLASILSKHTGMPVAEVHASRPIRAGHVYIIPPDRQLILADGQIGTQPFDAPRGQRMPIDRFFRSLAGQHRDGFAMVLSGNGSDGTIGLRAVKEAGGMILVQDPAEAEYGSMPRSAIATGCADVVLPVQELAAKLVELVGSKARVDAQALDGDDAALRRVLSYLHARTGHDFSQYKRPTILRRLARRMQLSRVERMEDYLDFLRQNVEEVQALFSDFLISVTTFFRDPEAFAALAATAIPELLARPEGSAPLRLWVAGCATGEEVYSLAMLLLEEAERHAHRPEIQIFATDVDAGALEIAREGLYPAAIEADVSEERLRRFFTREGEYYRIRKALRDLVVFASHSLLKDPPFSRLDLVSCRNLLIYLERDLQDRVLTTLHYALNPGGFLFLGSAETAEGVPGLFRTRDRKQRLYQALSKVAEPPLPEPVAMPRVSLPPTRHERLTPPPASSPGEAMMHRAALEKLAPPSVLIDAMQRLLHVSETAGRFFRIGAGTPSSNAVQLIRPELRLDLSRGLHLAFEKGEPSFSLPVPLSIEGATRRIFLHVQPVRRDGAITEAVAMFIDGGPPGLDGQHTGPWQTGSWQTGPRREGTETDADADAGADAGAELGRLHEALNYAQEQLRLSHAESEAATEELRAANEELQSINEQYRRASEELETSREELQSMNEELETLNAELKAKVEGLSQTNADLQNLMAATEGGTLFLDTGLRIKLFTPGIANHFNITAADIGRPITDFTHRLKYHRLTDDARGVLKDLQPVEREVQNGAGDWFLMRMRPYRTLDDRIDGVVATLIDVTQLHRTQEALRQTDLRFRALVSATSYVVYQMSPDWSEVREIIGNGFLNDMPVPNANWFDDYIDPTDQPQVRAAISDALRRKGVFELEHRLKRPDGTLGWIQSRAVPILDAQGEIVEWFGAASDVSAHRQVLEELAQARRIEAIGRLAAGISHDFNNLLTVITANLELAELRIEDGALRQLIDRAAKAAELGTSFNRRLLSLASNRVVTPRWLDLNDRVTEMSKLLERALSERIEVGVVRAADLWPARVDPGEVDSALLNLALNARDAMPDGGTITFITRNVTLDARRAGALKGGRPGDFACITVTDTGTGMARETLDRATEAFFSTKPHDLGTGLGLFSVQGFLREADGFLDLASDPGKGTSVSLYLPRAEPEEEAAAPAEARGGAPRGTGELILIVEGAPAVRAVTRERLETLGYRVTEAESAAAAMALLASGSGIRLVFSDVVLPDATSGRDLARWVRAEHPGVAVLLGSDHAPGPSERAETGGPDSVAMLAKPYELADLARALRALIG